MEGFIITYEAEYQPITLNNFLFGRVVKVQRGGQTHLYYYPGFLDNKKYYKLSNGSYFILETTTREGINSKKCDLDIKKEWMSTAREIFNIKYQGIQVNNLG